MISAIFAPAGLTLSPEEQAFFRDVDPYGFILFARNIETPDQVRALVAALKDCSSSDPCPILIDQEGGRVARLRPPIWPDYPPGAVFGDLAALDSDQARHAMALNTRLIAADLAALGINVDCLPVLDVPAPEGHDVIGDRAYGVDPALVADLGRAACEGLMAGGVLPVIKHIPGHGRGTVDSHHALPTVEASLEDLRQTDFAPFKALADMPFAMTAHILYTALDTDRPATTSSHVIETIIRGEIGFQGVLMSDDLNMKALGGTLADRAKASIAAGCDIALHCSGVLAEMIEIAGALDPVSADQARHLASAMAVLKDQDAPATFDVAEAQQERDRLLSPVLA